MNTHIVDAGGRNLEVGHEVHSIAVVYFVVFCNYGHCRRVGTCAECNLECFVVVGQASECRYGYFIQCIGVGESCLGQENPVVSSIGTERIAYCGFRCVVFPEKVVGIAVYYGAKVEHFWVECYFYRQRIRVAVDKLGRLCLGGNLAVVDGFNSCHITLCGTFGEGISKVCRGYGRYIDSCVVTYTLYVTAAAST